MTRQSDIIKRQYMTVTKLTARVHDTTHNATIQTALINETHQVVGDYRLGPRCSLGLRYSLTLRRVGRQLVIDVSVQPTKPIFLSL
jgi:hypothetical protein